MLSTPTSTSRTRCGSASPLAAKRAAPSCGIGPGRTFLTATGYVTPDGIDGNETVSPLVVKDATNALQVVGTNLWAAKTSWNPSGSFTTKWDNISVMAP